MCARVGQALVNVLVAVLTAPALNTVARIGVHVVSALVLLAIARAWHRCTLVNVDVAVLTCPSAVAGARIPVWSSVRALALLARGRR